jgi:hypothetical protein
MFTQTLYKIKPATGSLSEMHSIGIVAMGSDHVSVELGL